MAKKTAALTLAAGAGVLGFMPTAAHAAAPKTNYVFNAVGSDTIFCADNAVAPVYAKAQAKATGNTIANTPPVLGANLGCETTPSSFTVNADSVHGAITYNSTNLPPNGSSAGVNALNADNGAGTIAYARSSGGRGSFPSNDDFWAFALDGVTWANFQPSGAASNAPANLTASQLTQIYTCQVTDWSQVGGTAGTIQRFYPQVGSGTGKFFAQLFLGGTYPSSTGNCPVTYVEENDGTAPQRDPGNGDPNGYTAADAIMPYSFAVYTAQGNASGETDLHNGAVLGQVNKVAPTTKTISESQAFANISGDACTSAPVKNAFCGSRYVYHVTNQVLGTNQPAYQAAILAQVGVQTGNTGTPTTGFCANKYKTQIALYGFAPLKLATTAQSTSSDPVAGTSYCRQF